MSVRYNEARIRQPWNAEDCRTERRGVKIHVRDAKSFDSYLCELLLLGNIRKTHGELEFSRINENSYFIDHLAGTGELRGDNFDPFEYVKKQKPLA